MLRNELPCVSWLLVRLLHLRDLARRSTALPGEYAGHVRCPYDRLTSRERDDASRISTPGARAATCAARWCQWHAALHDRGQVVPVSHRIAELRYRVCKFSRIGLWSRVFFL